MEQIPCSKNHIYTLNKNSITSPSSTTYYIVTSSDGCSDNNIDTIPIFVLPTSITRSINILYNTSPAVILRVSPDETFTINAPLSSISQKIPSNISLPIFTVIGSPRPLARSSQASRILSNPCLRHCSNQSRKYRIYFVMNL